MNTRRQERLGLKEPDMSETYIHFFDQVGALSETFEATQLARSHGWGAFVSHRSGETVDSFIADLTVALDTGHLKSGAPARGERVEKYNRLLLQTTSLDPWVRAWRTRPIDVWHSGAWCGAIYLVGDQAV